MGKENRGFATMDRSVQREIARKGGRAAHQKGTAHEWSSEEAREAGRKGGMASHRSKVLSPISPPTASMPADGDPGLETVIVDIADGHAV